MKMYDVKYPKDTIINFYVDENGNIFNDEYVQLKVYHSTNGYDYVPLATSHGLHLYPVDEIVIRSITGHVIGFNNVKHIDGNLRNNSILNLKWEKMNEIWYIVEDPRIQKNEYKVSNFGGFSNKRGIRYPDTKNSRGYACVKMMTPNGLVISEVLHRLVARGFVHNPKPEEFDEINHIDGNKLNNHWKNLEWVSHKMNMQHAFNLKMVYRGRGAEIYLTKISPSIVHKICELFITYMGRAESVYYHIKKTHPDVTLKMVQHIKHKECWSHISDQYWTKDELNQLSEMKIRIICEHLIDNNGDTIKTVESLKDKIPDINKRFVEIVKYKEKYTDISDEYFVKGHFDKRISDEDVIKIREILYQTGMDHNETYKRLSDEIQNLTIRKIQKIKYKMIQEYKDGG